MVFVFTLTLEAAVFWIVTVFWLAEFFFFRSRAYGKSRGGWLSYVLIFTAIVVTFALTGLLHHLKTANLQGHLLRLTRYAALVFYAAGVGLRYWSALTLGSWFSRRVEARCDQFLVGSGPYRRLRHPLYLGLFLTGMGLNGLMGNFLGLAVGGILLAAVLHLRMVEEEQALESTLGVRYRVWKSSRYRFVPYLY